MKGLASMSPIVAVIIPLYKQSQYLSEAVLSAVYQNNCEVLVIIVNDGCPEVESDKLSRCLRGAYPERVVYLKKGNGGLSSARNVGVKYVLAQHPGVQFFFFLDADNVIGENFFERGFRAFESNENATWVYFPLRTFGFKTLNWKFTPKFNYYRQFFENQCDAGSIVRRELFDRGLFFDESLRDGYEDWEFFLRAARKGYYGVRDDSAEFLYRTKRVSMLTEAERKHAKVLSDIHLRHSDGLMPRNLLMSEHRHCPRFLLADVNTGALAACSRTDQIEWSEATPTEDENAAPLLLFSTEAHLKALAEVELLRPLLFVLQEAAAHNFVGVTAFKRGKCFKLGYERTGDFIIWGGETRALLNVSNAGKTVASVLRQAKRFAIETSSQFGEILERRIPSELIEETATRCKGTLRAKNIKKEEYIDQRQGSIIDFAWKKHVDRFETIYPICANSDPSIVFFVPWLRLGGVDLCVINVGKHLKRLNPNLRLHIAVTQENVVEVPPDDCRVFDEIIPVGHMPWERRLKACDAIAASADLAVNAHSAAAYEAIELRQARAAPLRFGRVVTYLHVIDQDHNGKLTGYAYDAAQRDAMFDGHIVISEQLRQFLINYGVSRARIHIAKNAPIVQPETLPDAIELAERKATRRTKMRPLQVLFAGRLDYQKGLPRLLRVMSLAEERQLDVEFTVVGSAVIAGSHPVQWPAARCRILPATRDDSLLQQYFSAADVFILLSRWEGVPLAILDAMAHGAVVIATDVGAVSEAVRDFENGYLIVDRDDEAVAMDAVECIEALLRDNTGSLLLRRSAVSTAFSQTWSHAADVFLALATKKALI
jgi:glycosyltransferase involved in cell wall biosynthesis/GT2 family glycosyltransferase